jgi:hypothetical protein
VRVGRRLGAVRSGRSPRVRPVCFQPRPLKSSLRRSSCWFWLAPSASGSPQPTRWTLTNMNRPRFPGGSGRCRRVPPCPGRGFSDLGYSTRQRLPGSDQPHNGRWMFISPLRPLIQGLACQESRTALLRWLIVPAILALRQGAGGRRRRSLTPRRYMQSRVGTEGLGNEELR